MDNKQAALNYVSKNSKPLEIKAVAVPVKENFNNNQNYKFDGKVLSVKVDMKEGGTTNVHSSNTLNTNNSNIFTGRICDDAPTNQVWNPVDVHNMGNYENNQSVSETSDKRSERREIKYNRLFKVISIFSNKISDYLQNIRFENNVKEYEINKIDNFYSIVQNAIFRSFMKFFDFEESYVKNKDGVETRRFTAPAEIEDEAYRPIILILDRLMDDYNMEDCIDINELMDKYYEDYPNERIDELYYKILSDRLYEKLPYTADGIYKIIEKINSIIDNQIFFKDDIEEEHIEHEHHVHHCNCGCNHSHEIIEEDEELNGMRIDILRNIPNNSTETKDMIRVSTSDEYGEVIIPFYTNLDTEKPLVYGGKSPWNFLGHFVPDGIFRSKNYEKWTAVNDGLIEEDLVYMVVLKQDGEDFTIGFYYMDGVFEDGKIVTDRNLLYKINDVISQAMFQSPISTRQAILNNTDIEYTPESDMEKAFENILARHKKEYENPVVIDTIEESNNEEVIEELVVDKEGDDMETKLNQLTEDELSDIEDMMKVDDEEKDKYEELVENDPKYSKYMDEEISFKPIKRKKKEEK